MTMKEAEPVVLDTSVVSILSRPDDFRYFYYQQRLEGLKLVVSFQTLEERWFGAFNRNWGIKKQRALEAQLGSFEVIWPTPTLVSTCARLRSDTRKAGHELLQADAWIAATAMMLDCPLAADNSDFSHAEDILGLTLIVYPR